MKFKHSLFSALFSTPRLASLLLPILLSNCASQVRSPEDKKVKIDGSKLLFTDFLVLSGKAMGEIDAAIAQNQRRYIVSDTSFKEENQESSVTLDPTAMRTFSSLRRRSEKQGKDLQEMNGPLILRCSSNQCAVDLKLTQSQVEEVNGEVKLKDKTNYRALLLGSILAGALSSPVRR